MGQDLEQSATPGVSETPTLKLGCLSTLLIILLVSTALDLYFFTGYFSSDDRTYFASAKLLAEEGGYSGLSLGAQRLPIVGWAALVILIAGPNFQIVAGSFVFFHQLINVLTFLLVKRGGDRRAALLAAFVLATFPLLITYSTVLLPDLEQTCGYLFAFLFYVLWRDNRERRPMLAWLAFCAAGAAAGVSYMVKEAALVLLPFFFAAWLTSFKRSRVVFSLVQGSAFAVGFFAMLYGEYLVLSHFAGEPFFRLGWTTKEVEGAVLTSVNKYGTDPIERLGWVAKRLDNYAWPHYLKIPIGLAMLVFPLLKPRRWALWLAPIWVFSFQVWGTMNFQRYVPPTLQARYFIVIVPFVTAVFAIVALRLYDWMKERSASESWRRRLRRGVLAAVIIPPVFGLYGPDRLAGKLYKSDIVGNATAAIRQVEQVDPGARIVLSTTLANFIEPLAGLDNLPYATARALSEERFVELIEAGRFFYIELDPEYMPGERASFRDSRLDTILRRTAEQRINPLRKALTDEQVVYRDALKTGGVSQIEQDGRFYEISTRIVNRSDRPNSRTWRLITEQIGLLPPAASVADVNSRTAVTYLVEIRPAKPPAGVSERRLVYDLSGSLRERRDDVDQDCLTNWGIGADAEKHAFERVGDGWRLHTNLGAVDMLWFMPRKKQMPPRELALVANGRYEVEIELALDGAVQVDLVLESIDLTQEDERARTIARAWLQSGKNVLGLVVDDRRAAIRPCFKLIGPGSIKFDSFKVYQAD